MYKKCHQYLKLKMNNCEMCSVQKCTKICNSMIHKESMINNNKVNKDDGYNGKHVHVNTLLKRKAKCFNTQIEDFNRVGNFSSFCSSYTKSLIYMYAYHKRCQKVVANKNK
ncbi:hypothetical protein AAHE18_18G208300 [Arachis hypogaea]